MRLALACIVCFALGWFTHTLVASYWTETVQEETSVPRYPLLESGAINDLRVKP